MTLVFSPVEIYIIMILSSSSLSSWSCRASSSVSFVDSPSKLLSYQGASSLLSQSASLHLSGHLHHNQCYGTYESHDWLLYCHIFKFYSSVIDIVSSFLLHEEHSAKSCVLQQFQKKHLKPKIDESMMISSLEKQICSEGNSQMFHFDTG